MFRETVPPVTMPVVGSFPDVISVFSIMPQRFTSGLLIRSKFGGSELPSPLVSHVAIWGTPSFTHDAWIV
jgi:hypothetical protein